jgi:dihydroorotate dehydrogenase (fumarate)
MTLSTTYVGMQLRNPIIVSSSKLTSNSETLKKCVDAGAGAVVLRSLYEEQIIAEIFSRLRDKQLYAWYPQVSQYIAKLSKEQSVYDYIRLIEVSKAQNPVPIIASINCLSVSEWTSFARHIEDAGADALELNISIFPQDEKTPCEKLENIYCDIVSAVRKYVQIPITVKIGTSFTNPYQMAWRLWTSGAQGIVLFNRNILPDIDIDHCTINTNNYISSPEESLQTLRWVALLSDKIKCEISASTGIHDGKAIIKQLLVGAQTVQVCSALHKYGCDHIQTMLQEIKLWMQRHHYESIDEFRNLMKKQKETINTFERLQLLKRDFED